jgi:hypothetical protein
LEAGLIGTLILILKAIVVPSLVYYSYQSGSEILHQNLQIGLIPSQKNFEMTIPNRKSLHFPDNHKKSMAKIMRAIMQALSITFLEDLSQEEVVLV